jgi:hypothetical protein
MYLFEFLTCHNSIYVRYYDVVSSYDCHCIAEDIFYNILKTVP